MKLKHCHFSILYNEIAFLKQKLPFLYRHFDQLIFFDLGVSEEPYKHSSDGSYEFIRDFPDPENKLTLIDKVHLEDVVDYRGFGSPEKQKMFSVGSSYVRDDIDLFWCTDMDEFFELSLIEKVESIMSHNTNINCVDLEHYIFWNNFKTIMVSKDEDTQRLYPRIARHKKGNIYGHCSFREQFNQLVHIECEKIYHFAFVGDNRVRAKINYFSSKHTGAEPNTAKQNLWWLNQIWENRSSYQPPESGNLIGYPFAHPDPRNKKGLKRYNSRLPGYIDFKELAEDMDIDTYL